MSSASASTSLSLKEYLKKYQSGPDDGKSKKKKTKQKHQSDKPKASVFGGIVVVDEDPMWQKCSNFEEEKSESSGEDQPQVDEDIEVKRMRRLEAIRARKPFHAISEDGSGWIAVTAPGKLVSNTDLSPPRQQKARMATPSPECEDNRSSAVERGDLSPPRRCQRSKLSSSPERKESVYDRRMADVEGSDLSPPRYKWRQVKVPSPKSELMESRQRGGRSPVHSMDDDDMSPRRKSSKNAQTQSHKDTSPSIRRVCIDSEDPNDLSPPRKRQSGEHSGRLSMQGVHASVSPPRKVRKGALDDLSPPPRKGRSDIPLNKKTGLLSAQELHEEIEKKKKHEKSRFVSMDPSMTGEGAEPVYRDKDGRRISKEDMLKANEEKMPKEKKLEWGKGLAQKRKAEAEALELEHEKNKPFARTRDDADLNKMLKERIRWGDPMAHLIKRKDSDILLEDFGDDEKMRESGFIVPQTIPSHSWLKRGLDFPPNRYGIRPGRHWDGVDRSNGYEKELFKLKNDKKATEQEAYLWSVSEM